MAKKESRGPELEIHSPGIHGSGNQTGTYYKVEYRTITSQPTVIGDPNIPFPFVIDNYWRTLSIHLGGAPWAANIPIKSWDASAAKHGLVSYVAAEAHRWAFISFLEANAIAGALCVETRLVAVKYTENYSTEEVGVTEPLARLWKPEGITPRNPKLPMQNDEAA